MSSFCHDKRSDRPVGSSGWGNTTREPERFQEMESEIERVRRGLVEAGASTTDANNGDWRVEFNGAIGLLWVRAGTKPCVYTDTLPSEPFGQLLSKVRVAFRPAPKSGWDWY